MNEEGSDLLLVMIRLAFHDGEGAVELLYENQAYHLVAEGHR